MWSLRPHADFAYAVWRFTRIPAPYALVSRCEDEGLSIHYLPLISCMIGAAVCGFQLLARTLFEPFGREPSSLDFLLLAVLAVFQSIWMAGGSNLDGLADTADGIAGGVMDREKALRIMSDPRVGAFGLIAVSLSILLKCAAIAALLSAGRTTALVWVPPLSRILCIFLLSSSPYVREGGAWMALARESKRPLTIALAALQGIAVLVAARSVHLPIAFAIAVLVVLYMRRFARIQLGGVTGDVCGGAIELLESFLYATVSLIPY